MLEWAVVAVIVGVASILLGRTLYHTLTRARPGCACGQTECSLADSCEIAAHPEETTLARPDGCPIETDKAALRPRILSGRD